ncbi:MAG: DUF4421 domain-containing protein [Bacteroidales bacterium]|nr:DUF4421 domain-containing protein [Bacteroidales bacterium]
MRKPFLLFLIALYACASQAQVFSDSTLNVIEIGKEMGKIVVNEVKKFNSIDTLYIEPQHFNLTFMLEHSSWFERYHIRNRQLDNGNSHVFSPNINNKIGVYFGWRWVFAGISFDIRNILGKKSESSRKELEFSIYSSKFGVDLYYRKSGDEITPQAPDMVIFQGNDWRESYDGIHSNIHGLNAYWIFNHKHFSYPAAFSQSTCQRRSAGSFMAGFAYSRNRIGFKSTILNTNSTEHREFIHDIKYHDYNLSFGYGYNWVFHKNWLANVSLMPAVGLKKSRTDQGTGFKNWINDINFDLIGRAGLVYNDTKYFFGMSFVSHSYDYRKSDFAVTNSFGVFRVYAGFNFWRKAKQDNKSRKITIRESH